MSRGKVVHVTKEDIDGGIKNSSSHCMIADAIKRQYGGEATKVSVDLQTIRLSRPAKRERLVFFTPAIAQRRLLEFDAGVDVEPFTLKLARPVQVLPMGSTATGRAKRTVSAPRAGQIPTVKGGKALPVGPLAGGDKPSGRNAQIGRRRAYGLRAMAQPEASK